MERYIRRHTVAWKTECGRFWYLRASLGDGWEVRLDSAVSWTEEMGATIASGVLDTANRWPTRRAAQDALDDVLRSVGERTSGRMRIGEREWQTLDGTIVLTQYRVEERTAWSSLVKGFRNGDRSEGPSKRCYAYRSGFPTRREASEWGRERQAVELEDGRIET